MGVNVLNSLEQKSLEYIINKTQLKIGEDFRLEVQNDNRAYALLTDLNKGVSISVADKTFLENYMLNNFGTSLSSLNKNELNQVMDSIVMGKIIAVADNYGSGQNYPYLAALIQPELAADQSAVATETIFAQLASLPGINGLITGERLNYLLNDDVIGLNQIIPLEVQKSRNENLDILREIGNHLDALKTAEMSHAEKLTHIKALKDFVDNGVQAGVINESIKAVMYKEIMDLAGLNGNQFSLLQGVFVEQPAEDGVEAGFQFAGESYVEGLPLVVSDTSVNQSGFMVIGNGETLADYRDRVQKVLPAVAAALYRMSDNIGHQWSFSDIDPSGIVLQLGTAGDVVAVVNADNANNNRVEFSKPFDLLLLLNQMILNNINPAIPENLRIKGTQNSLNLVFSTIINEANGVEFIKQALTELDNLLIDSQTGLERTDIQTDGLRFNLDDYRSLRDQLRSFVEQSATNLPVAQSEFEINAINLADSIAELMLENKSVNQAVLAEIQKAADMINNAKSPELRDMVISKFTSEKFVSSLDNLDSAVLNELYKNLFDNLNEQAVVQLYNKLDGLVVSEWNFMELPVIRDIRQKISSDISVDIKQENFLQQIQDAKGTVAVGNINIELPDSLIGYLATLSNEVTELKETGKIVDSNKQFDFLVATVLAAGELTAERRKAVINGLQVSFERQRRLSVLLDVLMDNANPSNLYWLDADRQLLDVARTVGINVFFDIRQQVVDKNHQNVSSALPIYTIASDIDKNFQIVEVRPNLNNPYYSLEHQAGVGVDMFSAYHAQDNTMASTLQTAGFHGYFQTDVNENGHVSWLIEEMFPVTMDQFNLDSDMTTEQPSRENFNDSDVSFLSYQTRLQNVINEIRNPLLAKHGYSNVFDMVDEYEQYYVYMSAQDRAAQQVPDRLRNYLSDFMNAFTLERAKNNARLRLLDEYSAGARGTAEMRARRADFNKKVENGEIQIQPNPFTDRQFNEVLAEGAVKGIVVLVTDPATNLDMNDPASVFNDPQSNFYKAKQRAEQENIPLVLIHHYPQQAQESVMQAIENKVSALDVFRKIDEYTADDITTINGLLTSLTDLAFTQPAEFNTVRQELLWWVTNSKDDDVRNTAWTSFAKVYSNLDNLLEQDGDAQIRQNWQISHSDIYNTDSVALDISSSIPATNILSDIENLITNSNVVKRMLFSIYGLTDIQASSVTNVHIDYLDEGALKNAHLVSVTIQGHPQPYRFVLNQQPKDGVESLINSLKPVALNEQAGTQGLLPVFGGVYNEFDGNTQSNYNLFVESYLPGLPFVRLTPQQASLDMIHKFDSESQQEYFDRMADMISSAAGILYQQGKNSSFEYNAANINAANIVMHMNQDNRYEGGLSNVRGLQTNEHFFDAVLYIDMILKSGALDLLEPDMVGVYIETYLPDHIFDGIMQADPENGLNVLEQTRDSLNEFIQSHKDTPRYDVVKKIGAFESTLEQLIDFESVLSRYITRHKAEAIGDTTAQSEESLPEETSVKLARFYGDLNAREQQGGEALTFTQPSNFEDLAVQILQLKNKGLNIPENLQPLFDGSYLDNLEQNSPEVGLAILSDILKAVIDDSSNPALVPGLAQMNKTEITKLINNLTNFVASDFSNVSLGLSETQNILQDLPAQAFVGERLNNALVSMNNGKPYTVINLAYDLRPGFGNAAEIRQAIEEAASQYGLTDSDVILIKTVSPLEDGTFNISLNADTLGKLRSDVPAIAYGTTFETLAFTFKKTIGAKSISESNLSFSDDLQQVKGLGSEFIRNEYAVYQMAGLSAVPVKSLTKELRIVSLLNREVGAEFALRDHFETTQITPSNYKRFYSMIDLLYRVGMMSNENYLKLFQARSANDFQQVKPIVYASIDASGKTGETDTQSLLRHISDFNSVRARLDKVIKIAQSFMADPALSVKYPQIQTALNDVIEFAGKFRSKKDNADYSWTPSELAHERILIKNIEKYETAVTQAVRSDTDGAFKAVVNQLPATPDVNAAYDGTAVFMKNALGGYLPLTGQVPAKIAENNRGLAMNAILRGMNMVQDRADIERLKDILNSPNPLENIVKQMNSVPAQQQNEMPVMDVVDHETRISIGERFSEAVTQLNLLNDNALKDLESLADEIEALGFTKAAQHIRDYMDNALEIAELKRSSDVNERIAGNERFMDFRTKINADFFLIIGLVYNGDFVFDFYSDDVEEHKVTVDGKQKTVLVLRGKRVNNDSARAQYIMIDTTYPLPGYPQGAYIIYTENKEVKRNSAKRIIELLNMRKSDNPAAAVLLSQIQDLSIEEIGELLERNEQVHEMKHFLDDVVKSPVLDNLHSAEASAVLAPLMSIIAKLNQDSTLTESERNELYDKLDSVFALEIINRLFFREDFMTEIMHKSARAPYQLAILFFMAAVISPELSDVLIEKIKTGAKDNQVSDLIEILNEELGILTDSGMMFSKKITDEFKQKYIDFVNEKFPNKTERGKAIAEALKAMVDKLAQDDRYGEFADMGLWDKLNETLSRKNVKQLVEKMDFNQIVQSILKDKKLYPENQINELISRSGNITPQQQRLISNLNLIAHGMPLPAEEQEYIKNNPDDSWNNLLSTMNGWLTGQNKTSSPIELDKISAKLGDDVAAWAADLYTTKVSNLFDKRLKEFGIERDVKLIEYALTGQLKVTPLGFVSSFEKVFTSLDNDQDRNRVLNSILLKTNKLYSDLEKFVVAVTGVYPQSLMPDARETQRFFTRKSEQNHLNTLEMENISMLASRLAQSFMDKQPLDKLEASQHVDFMLSLLRSPVGNTAQIAALNEIIAETSQVMGMNLTLSTFNLLFKDSTGYSLSELVEGDVKLGNNNELVTCLKLSDQMKDSFEIFDSALNQVVSVTYMNPLLLTEADQREKLEAMKTVSDLLNRHPDLAIDMMRYLDSFINNSYEKTLNSFINRFDSRAVGKTFTSMFPLRLIMSYSQLTSQGIDIVSAEYLSSAVKAANDNLLATADTSEKSLQRKSVEDINSVIKENIEKGKAVRISLNDLKNNISEDLINPLFEGSEDEIADNLQGLFTDLPEWAKTELMLQLSDPMSRERLKKSLILGLDVFRSSKMINEIDDFSLTLLLDWEGDFFNADALAHVGATNKSFYLNLSTLMYISDLDPEQQAYSKRILQAVYEHEYRDYLRGGHADDIGEVDPVSFQGARISFRQVEKFWTDLQNRPKEVREQRVVDGQLREYFKIQPEGLPEFIISSQFLDEMGILSAGKAMALLSRAAALNHVNLKKVFANQKEVVLENLDDFETQYGKDNKIDLRRFSSKIPVNELDDYKPLELNEVQYADQLKNLEFGSDFFIVTPVFNLLSRDDPDLMENILKKAYDAGYLDKLVIVDDASTDGTQELLKRFNRKYNIQRLNNELQKVAVSLTEEGITQDQIDVLLSNEAALREEMASWENYINPETGEQVYDFNMVLRDKNGHRTGAIRDVILGLYSLSEHGEIQKLPEKLFIMDGDSYIQGTDISGALKDAANMLGTVEKDGNRIIASILPLSTAFGKLPKGSTLLQKMNFLYLAWLRSLNTMLAQSVPGGGGGYLVPYLVRALSKHSGIFETDDAELSGLLRQNKHSKFKFFGRRDFRVITDMPETLKGKWIQSRRWSGGMFQLLRKGTKLPEGMRVPVILTTIMYAVLGIMLPAMGLDMFATVIYQSGIAGFFAGHTDWSRDVLWSAFFKLKDFLPLLYAGITFCYIIFVAPVLYAGSHATRYEKVQTILMAPLMAANFFFSSFVASFYEFFLMVGDYLLVRPVKFLIPAVSDEFTMPSLPAMRDGFVDKYFEPSKLFATGALRKLKEDPDFLKQTTFLGILGAFLTTMTYQHMSDTNNPGVIIVNILLTAVGFSAGVASALWHTLPELRLEAINARNNNRRNNPSLARSEVRPTVDNEIEALIESGDAIRINLKDISLGYFDVDELVSDMFDKDLSNKQLAARLQKKLKMPSSARKSFAAKLEDPEYRVKLQNALKMALSVIGASEYRELLKDFSITLLIDEEGAFYRGDALAHAGLKRKTIYLNTSTLEYVDSMEGNERVFGMKVLKAVLEHEFRDWARGVIASKGTKSVIWNSLIRRLYKDPRHAWFRSWVDLYKKAPAVQRKSQYSETLSAHQKDIGTIDPVEFGRETIDFAKVDAFWNHLQQERDPKITYMNKVVSLKSFMANVSANTQLSEENRNSQLRSLVERYVEETTREISSSVFINYDFYIATTTRREAVSRVKDDAILLYEALRNELMNLSETYNIDLADIVEDIKTLLWLYTEFNETVGTGYSSKDEAQANGMLRALDYDLLKREGIIKRIQNLQAKGINAAIFLDVNELQTENDRFFLFNNLEVILAELENIPDDIIDSLPAWGNEIAVSAKFVFDGQMKGKNKVRKGWRRHGEVFIAGSDRKTFAHEYIGHHALMTLIERVVEDPSKIADLETVMPAEDIMRILLACSNTLSTEASLHTMRFSVEVGLRYYSSKKIIDAVDEYNSQVPEQYQVSRVGLSEGGYRLEKMSFRFLQWAIDNNEQLFWVLVGSGLYFATPDDIKMGLIQKGKEEDTYYTNILEIIAYAMTNDSTPERTSNPVFKYDLAAVRNILASNYLKGWLWDENKGWYKPKTLGKIEEIPTIEISGEDVGEQEIEVTAKSSLKLPEQKWVAEAPVIDPETLHAITSAWDNYPFNSEMTESLSRYLSTLNEWIKRDQEEIGRLIGMMTIFSDTYMSDLGEMITSVIDQINNSPDGIRTIKISPTAAATVVNLHLVSINDLSTFGVDALANKRNGEVHVYLPVEYLTSNPAVFRADVKVLC